AGAGPADLALAPYDGGAQQPVSHGELAAGLHRLAGAIPVSESDVVLAAPPGGGRDYTVLLDLALLQGAARAHGGTAAIVHPGTARPAGLDLRMVTAACC